MKSNYFEFNWYFKREHKNVYPSIDNNGILPSKSYYLLELPPDFDIWQVSYTRAHRSFSIIKYQTTIKNYQKKIFSSGNYYYHQIILSIYYIEIDSTNWDRSIL